jgi:cyclohexanone monooxygenase
MSLVDLTAAEIAEFKATYRAHRAATRQSHGGLLNPGGTGQPALSVSAEEREAAYAEAWGQGALFSVLSCFADIMTDEEANETAAEFIRGRIRAVVEDPDVAEKLCPRTYPFGAKRACLDTNYYASYNRPNVELVDLRTEPIERVTAFGVRTAAREYPVDVLVFATGFDAITGPLLAMDIHGRGGTALRDVWAEHPDCYLGLSIAGFPNLFTITGPGSPSVLVNMAASIEQHVEWVADAIAYLDAHGFATIEAQPEEQQKWMAHVAEIAGFTLWPRAESWYTGANVPGKPRRFMPYIAGMQAFRQVCEEVVAGGYRGFTLARRAG